MSQSQFLAQFTLLFVGGLAASLHCVGMCGGFAVSAGRSGAGSSALYSIGRLLSYTTIGAIVGAIGRPVWAVAAMNGLQGTLSIIVGLATIVIGLRLLGLFGWPSTSRELPVPRLFVAGMSALMPPAGPSQSLTLGMVNGLLPCPVVQAFLPLAFAAGSLQGGAATMLALGLGTLPAMLAVGFFGGWRQPAFPRGWLTKGPGLVVSLFGFITVARIAFLWFQHDMGIL